MLVHSWPVESSPSETLSKCSSNDLSFPRQSVAAAAHGEEYGTLRAFATYSRSAFDDFNPPLKHSFRYKNAINHLLFLLLEVVRTNESLHGGADCCHFRRSQAAVLAQEYILTLREFHRSGNIPCHYLARNRFSFALEGWSSARRRNTTCYLASCICCNQSAVTMRLGARLTSAKLTLFFRSGTTGWTTDRQHLFTGEFSRHRRMFTG
jgi:hypothetical protein